MNRPMPSADRAHGPHSISCHPEHIEQRRHSAAVLFLRYSSLLPYEVVFGLPSFENYCLQSSSALNAEENRDGSTWRHASQTHYSQAPIARDRAARRKYDLRNGTARRVSAALRPFPQVRGLGLGRSRSLVGIASSRAHSPRATSGSQATPHPTRQRAGSGTKRGIAGGMSTGTCFRPATQASMMSDHSCIM